MLGRHPVNTYNRVQTSVVISVGFFDHVTWFVSMLVVLNVAGKCPDLHVLA
jgi:hypothetical protein